jgi:hypothetical protein
LFAGTVSFAGSTDGNTVGSTVSLAGTLAETRATAGGTLSPPMLAPAGGGGLGMRDAGAMFACALVGTGGTRLGTAAGFG